MTRLMCTSSAACSRRMRWPTSSTSLTTVTTRCPMCTTSSRTSAPTILLLDLHLPQRDGKEILHEIKAMGHRADVRVVIVTGSHNPADRRETLALGADAYFVKPFALQEFMQLGAL